MLLIQGDRAASEITLPSERDNVVASSDLAKDDFHKEGSRALPHLPGKGPWSAFLTAEEFQVQFPSYLFWGKSDEKSGWVFTPGKLRKSPWSRTQFYWFWWAPELRSPSEEISHDCIKLSLFFHQILPKRPTLQLCQLFFQSLLPESKFKVTGRSRQPFLKPIPFTKQKKKNRVLISASMTALY